MLNPSVVRYYYVVSWDINGVELELVELETEDRP